MMQHCSGDEGGDICTYLGMHVNYTPEYTYVSTNTGIPIKFIHIDTDMI